MALTIASGARIPSHSLSSSACSLREALGTPRWLAPLTPIRPWLCPSELVALSSTTSRRRPSASCCADGYVDTDQVVELPIVEGAASFSGAIVVTDRQAAETVEAFVQGADPARLGYSVEP